MAILINGNTAIDDSKNFYLASVTFSDASSQNTAPVASDISTQTDSATLLFTIDNPNAYSTSANDQFGVSVSSYGNYAVAGANFEDFGGSSSGAAYIFRTDTGEVVHTLTNPNAYNTGTADGFGFKVAMYGKYTAVSASQEDDTSGTASGVVYVFNTYTGELIYTLTNPSTYSTGAGDEFGYYALAMSSQYLCIGAWKEDDSGGADSGVVHVYDLNNGTLLYTLTNPNVSGTSAGDNFGTSLAVSDKYIAINAYNEDILGTSTGIVYIYYTATGKATGLSITNPNAYSTSDGDSFGHNIAIDGDTIAISAVSEDEAGGADSGKVYVLDLLTGNLLFTISNPNAYSTVATDYFGTGLKMNEDFIVAGASSESSALGIGSGRVYVFNRSGSLLYTLSNPYTGGATTAFAFGSTIGLSGNKIVTSSYAYPGGLTNFSGICYVYNLDKTYSISDVKTANGLERLGRTSSEFLGSASLQTVLNNPNAYSTSSFDFFGVGVSISENYAIVGASIEDDTGGSSAGKAYIFNAKNGALLYTLNNPSSYSTSAGDQFGNFVTITDKYAAVGAYQEDDASGTESGKVYIYDTKTGVLLYTLNNPNAYSSSGTDWFGTHVSISGDYAIISAFFEDDAGGADSGKAYIYNLRTGTLMHTLANPNAYSTSANDNFGKTVSISGGLAIVGAYLEDDSGGAGSGKAYIYNVLTGALMLTLSNPNAYSTSAGDQFGRSVSISGNRAIVSASAANSFDANGEDDASGANSGKVYIFDATTGSLLFTLNNPNVYSTSADDNFGEQVSISGNLAIVSAYREDDSGGATSGKAYIFDVTTGALLYTLNNPNAYSTSADDQFGFFLSISGNRAIVGAYNEGDTGGGGSGKAYIFKLTENSLEDRLVSLFN